MNSEGAANMAMEGIVSSSISSNSNNANMMNDAMMVVMQSNSNDSQNSAESNPNNRSSRRKALWKKRQRRSARKQQSGGRLGGRRQRRFWQLPESSIMEYQQWIQDKPEADRTPSEERFLWKCMIRSLGVVGGNHQTPGKRGRHERIREFVDRLEQKEPMELTKNEEHFIRLYRKRQQDRKAQRQQDRKAQRQKQKKQQDEAEQVVSWMRNDENSNNNNHSKKPSHQHKGKKKNKKNKGFEPSASLESLRESMNKMGLSSDKLKQVRFAEPPPLK